MYQYTSSIHYTQIGVCWTVVLFRRMMTDQRYVGYAFRRDGRYFLLAERHKSKDTLGVYDTADSYKLVRVGNLRLCFKIMLNVFGSTILYQHHLCHPCLSRRQAIILLSGKVLLKYVALL